MKNNVRTLITASVGLVLALYAHATDTNKCEDAEQLAQAFLLHVTDHYSGSLRGQMMSQSNALSPMRIDFIMTKDLFVTNMTVNGTNIPLSRPLGGLPIPDSGYQGASIDLYGWDKGGDWASHGAFNTNIMRKESCVTIVMRPHFPPVAIPVSTSDPNSIEVSLPGANSWSWYYDGTLGAVVISALDTSSEVSYLITDSLGNILAHGQMPFFQNKNAAVESLVINPQQAGNVREAEVDGPNWWLSELTFDCTVLRSNVYVPAKVFNVSDVGGKSGLEVYVYGVSRSIIEVRSFSATDQMTLVPTVILNENDEYGWTIVATTQRVDKAVVTVLPPNGIVPPGTFQVGFYRW